MEIERIKDLIAKNELEQALTLSISLFPGQEKDLILLNRRLEHLKKKERRGIISNNEEIIEKNKISSALLELLVDKKNKPSKKEYNKNLKDKKKATIILSMIGSIASIIGLVLYFISTERNGNKIEIGDNNAETNVVIGDGNNINQHITNIYQGIDDEKYKYCINDRWGILFKYPNTWDRKDPFNNDGHRFSHPLDDKIFISGTGIYWLLEESEECSLLKLNSYQGLILDEFCFMKVVSEEINYLKEEYADLEIITQGSSGKWLINDIKDINNLNKEKLPGYKLIFKFTNEDGKKIIEYIGLTHYSGARILVRGQCPIEKRDEFENMFLDIISNFLVLRRF